MSKQEALFYWRAPGKPREQGNDIELVDFSNNGVGVEVMDSDGNTLIWVTIDTSLTVRINGREVQK